MIPILILGAAGVLLLAWRAAASSASSATSPPSPPPPRPHVELDHGRVTPDGEEDEAEADAGDDGRINGRAAWTRVPLSGAQLNLDPGTYAAVFELEGIEATFGGAADIQRSLEGAMSWAVIMVSATPDVVPASAPITRERKRDRYWGFGTLAAPSSDERPSQLRELWRFR